MASLELSDTLPDHNDAPKRIHIKHSALSGFQTCLTAQSTSLKESLGWSIQRGSKASTVLCISNVLSQVLPTSGQHQFTYYQNEMQLVSKNNSAYHEADKGATWHSVYPSLAQIEMTMRSSVLLQQFSHLVCIPIAPILK